MRYMSGATYRQLFKMGNFYGIYGYYSIYLGV